ncbi:hypothetical protein [Paenibacillus hunanensis]|uniref:DUF5668 domain-containing protein n=1 Tax=Paenibacillus hunanensis TaxID=539262 RepID=A0ABU1J187_9BACL|nr:hypothetical protein [Paenibacillus hunanensis]MDR6245267.1 hypothetical protein [Paenibacillus hunanensis]GGJ26870.1 hypothetical protein GCM10008022_39720 [Paenibacillus hunanensis]
MIRRAILAPVLLLLGVYLFLNPGGSGNAGEIFAVFWPTLFVIPLGLFLHWLTFSLVGRKGIGMLIPGGILIVSGLVSQIAQMFGLWSVMWPGFILAVAVGLFEFYWFGSRNKWLLIPINLLTVLSLLFFAVFSIDSVLSRFVFVQPLVAVALLLGGAWLMFARKQEW